MTLNVEELGQAPPLWRREILEPYIRRVSRRSLTESEAVRNVGHQLEVLSGPVGKVVIASWVLAHGTGRTWTTAVETRREDAAHRVASSLAAHGGSLWVGTSGGVVRWNLQSLTAASYTRDDGLADMVRHDDDPPLATGPVAAGEPGRP